MQVAIISDTHIPSREAAIPEPFRERIAQADHVIHAGDFDDADALEMVRDLAAELTAVHGNIDPDDIGLPSTASVELEGVTFAVVHGTVGSIDEWLTVVADVAAETAADPVVGIGGHTHFYLETIKDGIHLVNPGSVTGAAPAEEATMLTADVEDRDVDVTLNRV